MKLSEATYFPDAKELTRHGFVSHMEDFIGRLIGDNPLGADVDDYLKGFDIDAPKALEMLTKPEIEDFPESAVVVKTERIKNGGYDENGKPMKDEFQVIYKVPKKDPVRGIKGIDEKLRNLYIKMFENHIVKGTVLNEDGEGGMCGDGGAMEDMGGATNTSSSGQYTTPAFGMMRRKVYSPKNEGKMKRPVGKLTMYITEEQMQELSKLISEEGEGGDGGFGGGALTTNNIGAEGQYPWYDAPFGTRSKKDPSMDHSNILSRKSKSNQPVGHKSLEEEDSGIHIKKSHEGKFTALKKRTGKSSTWYKEHGTPEQKKMATFALNSRKWHHK